ncbi:hypothetical protein ESA94_05485 [Lacibacter luteus]|uniref:Uncharacterized protein n=1 Tax=Lacibacter luteus TaxID=2508719 RepID=A0A4Q1CNX5_9BACT|nr:C25 family cysteine peptidase [Lacibacter luteus]RXK62455.1 hypothetical protein ESA94_05485 [Lacibacter luteus]
MKRILLYIAFLFCAYTNLSAQTYMNEWIDFNKTYYKFKVRETGLYRISQAQLAALGIATADAAHFQLWRHGQQVPIFTSSTTGTLPTNGFIEFYGMANDGKWEKRMYLDPSYQINDKWSLFTDTAAYFLTVNTNAGQNKRFVTTNNDLSSGLAPESYFIHTAATYFKNVINQGFAAVVGSYVYSSAFDRGEGYTSGEFRPGSALVNAQSNLYVAAGGPAAKLKFSAAGRALNTRSVRVSINGTVVADREMNYFNSIIDESADNIPLSLLASNSASVQFDDVSAEVSDRIVVGMYELRYPRQFNFAGQTSFEFEMPASATGNNLVIDNFNFSGVAPVLYDLTNGLRITASIVSPTQVRIVLPASATDRKLVLVSQEASTIRSGTGFTARNFVNYALPANQADYIMISNPILYSDANGINQVEQYRLYRSSTVGGGFNAKIYNVQDIIDQFGYGIKNNAYAIKNFLRFAYAGFAVRPQYCFIVGKGVVYPSHRSGEASVNMEKLNLVPTLGNPASDMMMASAEMNIVPQIPIGRLTAVNGNEVKAYLDKVKQYETYYNTTSCNIEDEQWKKNVIHVAGANDFLGEQIRFYLNQYGTVLKDTLFGANIYSLQKTGVAAIQTIASQNITRLFSEGFSLLTYFGHSSPSTLEYNLSDPSSYPSIGKYPIMMVNGCQAGNMFLPTASRLTGSYIITESWVLTPQRGSVAFIASTHLGIVNYLHIYTEEFYNQLSKEGEGYGKSIGRIMANTIDTLMKTYSYDDFYVRMHAEEVTLHGDPAIKFYSHVKPDFAIEDAMVKVSPEFISIAETEFDASVKIVNTGRSVKDSVHVRITRIAPDGTTSIAYDQKVGHIPNADSIKLKLPIDPFKHKGTNKLKIEIDPENNIDESCEINNTVTKEFFIFEDEIRPIYPYNYSIINKQNVTYYSSTANPLGTLRKYYFQLDTTATFNSPFRKFDSTNSVGGLIGFTPAGVNFVNNNVYYWRVGMQPDANSPVLWNGFSFQYKQGAESGYNQSHFYQHKESDFEHIKLVENNRRFIFDSAFRRVQIRTGINPYHNEASLDVAIDFENIERYGCNGGSIQFYVFDAKTLKPWENWNVSGGVGRYLSGDVCGGYNRKFFEYNYYTQTGRKNAMDFVDSIPVGSYVAITNFGSVSFPYFDTANMKADQATFGPGKSLYHKIRSMGITSIDSFKNSLPVVYIFRKGDPTFTPIQAVGEPTLQLVQVFEAPETFTEGVIESPWFGPAKEWKNLLWDGAHLEPSNPDVTSIDVIGKTSTGSEILIAKIANAKDTTLDFISAQNFPYLKLRMKNADIVNVTPHQLQYWKLTASYVPEGAIAPNVTLRFKDTLELGEPFNFAVAFKNVSETAFDSLSLRLIITDRNNVPKEISLPKSKPLVAGDSIVVSHVFESKDFVGANTLYLMVNPDGLQPEQFLFNNFLYKNFYVKPDNYKPWLDVTFDGAHILNRDVVSSRPHIHVKLKDDNRFVALKDTSNMTIKIQYPSVNGAPGPLVEYKPQSDSVRFTAADLTNNAENAATIDLFPKFMQDGEYELIVTGTDQSGNKAGELEYKVGFQVINKPMISNMLNYPNPFTTSTSFVFTITGSEVPQNIRIQILTITGKVVREVTKAELGPLRIGRNITEFKWDGTDQFGNKLGNGVYLYRVITNHNGKGLEKYKTEDDNTDQYFNRGYGKMYLMR